MTEADQTFYESVGDTPIHSLVTFVPVMIIMVAVLIFKALKKRVLE